MSTTPIIEGAFLEKLERLAIRWQKSFPGLVGGHNMSRLPGSGQEFLDHRHFHHGDDLRAVNWRAYLRLEKLFLKMFQVEPRVPVRLLLDASASMQTGELLPKFEYARTLTAALCYVAMVRLDTVCIQPFGAALQESFVCSGGRHRFVNAINFLSRVPAGGRTNYLSISRDFVARYEQRGLLIVVSDFFDDTDCLRPLQLLADFGHELLLVHLWAEEDRTPPWEGQLEITDAESSNRLELTFDRGAREQYTAAFDDHARALSSLSERSGGRYVGLSTSTPVEDAIFGPLVRSQAIQ
jgi:uncharacterized protein (DUF58 family)